MTRAELIEYYFNDPDANPGLAPMKLRFAAEFADMSIDDQNAALGVFADAKKTALEAEATETRAAADALDTKAADVAAAKP